MKTEIVLKKTGQRVHTHKETARLLIEMGRAVTVEEHLAQKAKSDAEAESRTKKVVEPKRTKKATAK